MKECKDCLNWKEEYCSKMKFGIKADDCQEFQEIQKEQIEQKEEAKAELTKPSENWQDKFLNKIVCCDCLEGMKELPDNSVDMILCDLPYGTTACSWDIIIPFDKLWKQYERIIKQNGAIVLTAQQPFTSFIICSNIKLYKYNWIWEKDNGTNFLNSHFQPLKITEDICIFGKLGCSWNKQGNMNYFPQFSQGKPYKCISGIQKSNSAVVRAGKGGREDVSGHITNSDGKRYPKNIVYFCRDKDKLHPTQKPVPLFEYLIKTYTNKGDLVLDNCAGSFTTAIACENTERNWICMEKEQNYCDIGQKRLDENRKQKGDDCNGNG